MSQPLDHVRELADTIGPRPATTDAEARAADYIERAMRARGLEVERQEFDAPRTDALAFALEHALTIAAAVLIRWVPWASVVVGALAAVALWLDFDVRRGAVRFLPKGPSQNIVARHVPKARRGERLRKVVLVAHYDAGFATLDASPGLVRRSGVLRAVALGATALVPALALLSAIGIGDGSPAIWYAALAAAAVLLLPLVIRVHALVAVPVDGANDNASGVAAMLGVLERIVPEPETSTMSVDTAPMRRTPEAAAEAGVVVDEALLEYTPVAAEEGSFGGFGDVEWADERLPSEPVSGQTALDLGDARDDVGQASAAAGATGEEPRTRRLFGRRREEAGRGHRVSEWLGLSSGFDPRSEGKRIKSWDRLELDDEEDEDGFGFRGGTAGGDPFAAEEAARIRRKVTAGIDRALAEKEVWFVATGAKESGGWGMRALLAEYGADLRDALIINLDCVGAGSLAWLEHEGDGRTYRGDRRLASILKRVTRDRGLPAKARATSAGLTDATVALAARRRAITVMAFDINGRVAKRHTREDTVDIVSEEALQAAVDFVTEVVREL
ncbi:MAG: M28 family peptidase [Coriobacteriia bacterium]|nr:M28 family peptidase [Coriobacteriia bacterium]